MTFLEKFVLALTSGFVASIVGNPLDMCMVRMQSELYLPPEQRRNYRNVLDALVRIPKEESVLVYWRGFPTFSLRVMSLTGSQLTTFDKAKELIN